MKIAVITRHAVSNYGSFLQAFALQHVIEDMGHKCEIIDYVREDESYVRLEKTLLQQKTEWNNNPAKRLLYLTLRQPESIAAGKQFEKERKKYLKLTKPYSTLEQLKEDKPIADVYITGSDQVWGPVADGTYDSAYCLSFVSDSEKKAAYAASFGHTDMTPGLESYYSKWLGRYNHIAVRENSAAEILKRMDINASQVLDPTLLPEISFWGGVCTKLIQRRRYVLVYQIHSDKKLGRYAAKVAKEKGLPLIRISASLHQIAREGQFKWLPDIGEFIQYIKNAECMITDSFHGTAFAINFNIPFIEVLPNNNTGTRNMGILQMTGLSNRILIDEADIELANEKVDFSEANKILAKRRGESLAVLRKMLEC